MDPDVERRLSDLARLNGKTPGDLARELIEESIEEREDRTLAERRLEARSHALTSQQIREELGLDR